MAPYGNQNGFIHGWSATPEYIAWMAARQRCTNKRNPYWKNYGGRGIKVCKRWNKFENFIADMGPRPTKKHTLDRKDNDGGYNKANCRWTTRKQQQRNNRQYLNSIAREADRLGIKYKTLWMRHKRAKLKETENA